MMEKRKQFQSNSHLFSYIHYNGMNWFPADDGGKLIPGECWISGDEVIESNRTEQNRIE